MIQFLTDLNLFLKHLHILEFLEIDHLDGILFLVILVDVISFVDTTAEPFANNILFSEFICSNSDKIIASASIMWEIRYTFLGGDSS